MLEEEFRMMKRKTMVIISLFLVLVMAIVVGMNVKNTMDMTDILEDSVESQLLSISVAARELIDTDNFIAYNSAEDIRSNMLSYNATLTQLRMLARDTGAEYIYALKIVDGKYYFVYDTDLEDTALFVEYQPAAVHLDAFAGQESAGVMNLTDIYGSFNTGAVPMYKDGKVVGIVCTDIVDVFMNKSAATARRNAIILIASLLAAMGVMLYVVFMQTKRINEMQNKLQHLAHHDTITGLPNRQYLLEYLQEMSQRPDKQPYALFFIDLDNFKLVNDNAGHDAGDELLRHIAEYLKEAPGNAISFRPAAGMLNIAARIGGDEFVQVVSGVETEEQAAQLAEGLLENFKKQQFDRYIEKYGVGLSVGVALYPYHSDNFHVLIKYADIAMYHAKRQGKNTYRVYDDDMKQKEEK